MATPAKPAGNQGGPRRKESAGFAVQFSNPQAEFASRNAKEQSLLRQKYNQSVRAALQNEFGYKNPYQVPEIKKVVCNIGLGEALRQPKLLEQAFESLGYISGQRPVVARAKKSVATFKLRQGQKIGCTVTLRGARMWDFLDRLLTVALPRTRDFRGVSRKAFDGRGNYTLGIRELLIFPEIDIDKLDKVPGMNVCIHTTAQTDDEGRALLTQLGMPFRQP